jgi:hypothetical protein
MESNLKEEENDLDIFIKNCSDYLLDKIQFSTENKLYDYKLNLETIRNKEGALKYIDNEQSDIRILIKETVFRDRSILNGYREFLNTHTPNDKCLKREILNKFINILFYYYYLDNKHPKSINDIVNKDEYIIIYQLEMYKNFTLLASLLEYNHFLISEVDRLNENELQKLTRKGSKTELVELQKLTWQGSKTELVELIKSLKETGSIEGTQKDIIRNFLIFLNADIKHPNATLHRLTNRYDKTIFLDKLTSNLKEFYTKLEFNSFLSGVIDKIEQEDFNKIDSDNNKLNWLGTPTELIELCIALFVNKSIKGTQKDIIRNFFVFLNVSLKATKIRLHYLADHPKKTIFLDKLTSNLKEFYTKSEA